ncbi:hypothetical protein RHSIM_Rhsim11G0005100 [Rhododendron simsii]|uniref:Aminotransferase-like plant mobile domain-containing protein n=1 Tax=Rhododendron simsii TaxID=118357 RepID=A0A834G781_RHOSS|nr:hypothetical protein RHSIM_Rhsim11G0005100 [Rhododendron simsii]
MALDPLSLSSADERLVEWLRKAYTEAGKYGSRFDREGRARASPKSGKTSWSCWLRYFFKDLPPPGTAPPAGQASEFYGKMYDSDLHLAGFLLYWLSFFVIPNFSYEGPNHTIFPLAVSLARRDFVLLGPLFLGSLFHHLDQVHADIERSMGCYDMVSVVHTQFLMAFCFEHFPSLASSPAEISGENDRTVDFQTEGITVSASALAVFAAARRVLSLHCVWKGRALCCIVPTGAFVGELTEGFNVVVLSRNDRETFFTANGHLAWGRNLDSFINYVCGVPEILTLSDVYHRDMSLRSPKARQPGWRGKKSYWASSSTTPAASHGVTIAAPLSTVIPPRLTLFEPIPFFRVPLLKQQGPLALKRPCSSLRHEVKEYTPLSKKVVVDLAEGESDGTDNDSEGGDGRNSERVEGSDADSSEGDGNEGRDGGRGDGENLGVDTTHLVVEQDEDDDDKSSLIPRRRIPTEGFLSIPDINQLAPEAVAPQLPRGEVVKSAFDPFRRRANVPPTGDIATHFQEHDAAVALTNLTSVEVFADFSSIAGGAMLQQHAEARTSHGQEAIEDDSDVRVLKPPISNEEEVLSNEAFFGQFRLTCDETSFLSFVRDRFPYTFFKIRGLYSVTMGRMQLQCLHHFLLSIKDIRELDAAKIMRENEKLWRHCEGAKVALKEAQVALARARDAVVVAEAVVEEHRLVYEHMAEEARLGDRLIDVPLCDTDPFLKKVFG